MTQATSLTSSPSVTCPKVDDTETSGNLLQNVRLPLMMVNLEVDPQFGIKTTKQGGSRVAPTLPRHAAVGKAIVHEGVTGS